MKRSLFLISALSLVLSLFSLVAPAQTSIPVSGVVRDDSGHVVKGVSVTLKGSTTGTTTDDNGKFTLRVPNRDAMLVFSFVGYSEKEVKASKDLQNVTISSNSAQLNDIVVVGYGTQRKVSMTSAVAEVSGKELTTRPVNGIEQALQGKVPGLTILDKGGLPGRGNTPIVLRGVNTLYRNEDLSGAAISPLFLVDGVEQPYSNINPNDIESVSVLKDASSTAIYGSRASNGVILITTKRAKSGRTIVSYNGLYANQKIVDVPVAMDLASYLKLENLAYKNVGSTPPKPYGDADIDVYLKGNATDPIHYPLPYDWYRYVLHTAPQTSHSVSVAGGNENFRARASFRFQDQDGIIDNVNTKLAEARVNTDFTISPRISGSVDVDYRYETDQNPYGFTSIMQFLEQNAIFTVPQYPNGDYGGGSQGNNPLLLIQKGGYNKTASDYLFASGKVVWEVFKGLKFTTIGSTHSTNYYGKLYANTWSTRDSSVVKKSNLINNLTETRNRNRDFTIQNFLDYHIALGSHDIKGLVGYQQIGYYGNTLTAYRQNFYNNDVQSISGGTNDATKDNSGVDQTYGLRSYFGRINYAFQDKYLFEANARFDGSSRFTGENKYSFFPSFSAGWRISQEKFWDGLRDKINELKLRGSYGSTGNQAVDLYSYYQTLNLVNYSFNSLPVQGYVQQNVANTDITWETTRELDLGLDASFLKNRFTLTFDYYKKRTSGILLTLPVPGTLGLNAGPTNAGRVDNTGVEIALGTHNRFGNFGFDANVNFSINENKVIDLVGTGPFYYGVDANPRYTIQEGYPIYAFWGYKTDGLYQTDADAAAGPFYTRTAKAGDVRYIDMNKDGKIDDKDQTYLGNTVPKYTYAGNFSLSYKAFALNIFLQGTAASSMRMALANGQAGNYEGFVPDIYTNNLWTPTNTGAHFPRPTKQDLRNQTNNDLYVLDASYLRVKNIQLVYTLPAQWIKRASMSSANIYVSATNVLTFSSLKDWHLDPESLSGYQNYYPQVSLYTVGVNVTF